MTDITIPVDLPLSALTSDRQEEIKRSQAQLGIMENLALGFKQTALYAGARKIEQEAVIRPTALSKVQDLDIPAPLKAIASQKALELGAGVASIKALFGATAEGVDPSYVRADNVDELISGIPRKYHDDIMSENSLEAAQRVRGRILEDLEQAELAGLQNDGASFRLAGSLIDVDAPLAFMSGGSYAAAKTAFVGARAAKALKLGETGQRRLAGLTQGVSGGAQAGLLVGGADAYLRETTDGLDVIYSTLGGAVLGGTFGGTFGADTATVRGPKGDVVLPKEEVTPTAEGFSSFKATLEDFKKPTAEEQLPTVRAEWGDNLAARLEQVSDVQKSRQDRITSSPNLEEVFNDLTKKGFTGLEKIGQGAERIVLASKNHPEFIIKISDLVHTFEDNPNVLSPVGVKTYGNLFVEVVERVTPVNEEQLQRFIKETVKGKGVGMSDPHPGNIGIDSSGKMWIIDGGTRDTKTGILGIDDKVIPSIDEVFSSRDTLRQQLQANLTATLDDFEARVASADDTLTAEPYVNADNTRPLSVGAAQSPTSTLQRFVSRAINDPMGTPSKEILDIIKNAEKVNFDNDVRGIKAKEQDEFLFKVANSAAANATGTRLVSRLYGSDSEVGMWFATNILESANGYGRGTTTSSILRETYNGQMQTHLLPIRTAANSWAKRNNQTFLANEGISDVGLAAFNREVLLERNRRMYGRSQNTDKDVALAADSLDNFMEQGYDIAKGKDGQLSIDGFEDILPNKHYYMQNWKGGKIQGYIQNSADPKAARSAIISGIAQSYESLGVATGKDALAIADAVISRKQHEFAEIDTSAISLLQKDGQDFLRKSLEFNNVPARQIDGIMKRLVGANKDRAKEGFAKSRNDVDLETTINLPEGPIQIVDLLSHNIDIDARRYARRVSGAAALARNGIRNRADRGRVITALNTELRSIGEEPIDPKLLEAVFTNFDGGATKGFNTRLSGTELSEQGSAVAVTKDLVSLSWLGKLGLTQIGETATTMAQVGLRNWAVRGPMTAFNKELRDAGSSLKQEAAFMVGRLGEDHHVYMTHKNFDEVSDLDAADFMSKVQKNVSSAQYIAGFTSLFNHVRSFQQSVAFLGMTDKVFRTIKQELDLDLTGNLSGISDKRKARLKDLGIDDTLLNYMENLVSSGTIEFKTSGGVTYVDRINVDQWDELMQEQFATVIIRNQNQAVQKSMAGESDPWMHTALGSMMTHLKTFPMQATQKQFVRHMRHNDTEAYAMISMGLATSMAVSMVKEAIDLDKTRDMDMADHAKRAFSYSNMTGFIPMAYDPLMTMMGMEDRRFNQFSPHTELTPPVLSYGEDVWRLPGALAAAFKGDATYSDRQSIRTLPYSNAYLVGDMWNSGATRNSN